MTNYSGNASGPINVTIPTLDTTDLFTGGPSGNGNAAVKMLCDNDVFLYKSMGGFSSIVMLAVIGDPVQNITVANLLRNIVIVQMNASSYFTGNLPESSTYPKGALAVIKRWGDGYANPVTLQCYSGDTFEDNNGNTPATIYLHGNESVTLYNAGGAWQILHFSGNYYNVGDQMLGYVQKAGTLKRDGTVYNRADYPRLWEWININYANICTDDTTWNSDPASTGLYPYKSLFSSGNGTTTFRVPDDRGLFDRAMTYTGGRDADRVSGAVGSLAGNIQADAFKSHTHTLNQTPHSHGITDPQHTHNINGIETNTGGTSNQVYVVNQGTNPNNGNANFSSISAASTGISINTSSIAITNENSGGTESRPINVAKHPLIVY